MSIGTVEQLEADIAAVSRIGAVPTILKVISEITGLRLALVARVTQDSWTACAVLDQMDFGLGIGDQLDVATTLCSEVRDSHQPIVIEHASEEPAFCSHPTPKMYGFESYLAFPIYRTDGEYFGNVCALDANPVGLRDPKTIAMMELFAELISLQLVGEEQAGRDRAALATERENAELREQFIAVLGHDLRNPLSSIVTGSEFLLSLPLETKSRTVLERIRNSGGRMSQLIDDVLDFARGRLGGGMEVSPARIELAALVGEVVDEIAAAHPDRTVRISQTGAGAASLDRSRFAQMLSNLVANAVEHSPSDMPIDVTIEGSDETFSISITNRGDHIASSVMERLFEPYYRAEQTGPRSGLGLGLYIAAEIARAHGGSLSAESTDDGVNTFTVDIPRFQSRSGPAAADVFNG